MTAPPPGLASDQHMPVICPDCERPLGEQPRRSGMRDVLVRGGGHDGAGVAPRRPAGSRRSGIRARRAGRARSYGRPVPWITPITGSHVWWGQLHGERLLTCQESWGCQVCGTGLEPAATVPARPDGKVVTNAALHERCADLTLAVCPGLSSVLLRLVVTPADLLAACYLRRPRR